MKSIFTKKNILYLIICLLYNTLNFGSADLIIFSYNRPLQLDALIRSLEKHVINLEQVYILYRSNGSEFDTAYQELQSTYPFITFFKQGEDPKSDFKPMLLNIIKKSPSEYILFAVDDIMVTDTIDIQQCIEALERTNAYGFYLRLGKNITFSYTHNISLSIPTLIPVTKDVFAFSMKNNKSYWSYPNTVDMTIYRKEAIMPFFIKSNYSSPNKLESSWHQEANLNQQGLCFTHSKIINTPLNIVQEDWHNKHDNLYPVKKLLEIWKQGLKIDIDDVCQINNNTAHISYQPKFINKQI